MAFHYLAAVVLALMLTGALRDLLKMRRYARLLQTQTAVFVTTPATIIGWGGVGGDPVRYRFRFSDENGRTLKGRFVVVGRHLPKLPALKALERGSAVTVTYARQDPECVYIEPYRDYYLRYLRSGQLFVMLFVTLVSVGFAVQVARIAGWIK